MKTAWSTDRQGLRTQNSTLPMGARLRAAVANPTLTIVALYTNGGNLAKLH